MKEVKTSIPASENAPEVRFEFGFVLNLNFPFHQSGTQNDRGTKDRYRQNFRPTKYITNFPRST